VDFSDDFVSKGRHKNLRNPIDDYSSNNEVSPPAFLPRVEGKIRFAEECEGRFRARINYFRGKHAIVEKHKHRGLYSHDEGGKS
jgi:hypothetical protein